MDNFIVSARKYRPMTFDMVVGQQAITSTLKNAIKNNHLAQAFLFTGPRGVGKTTCARILAKTINCFNPSTEMEACDECESCTSFNQSASFNIHELDAASNNSVDDIRSLIDQVRIPPQVGKFKVYIIDEVHMLSAQAFNAFLKTLEEPPAYAKFILATTEKHKIIPTILSRCQIYDFRRISIDDIVKQLQFVAEKEDIKAEEEGLHVIALKADGALRDALSIFDQIVSFSGNNITYDTVILNLNVLDYEYYFKTTEHLLNGDIASILMLLDEILMKGFDGQYFLNGLASHFRDLLVSKIPKTAALLDASQPIRERYTTQAQLIDTNWILRALDIANKADLKYKESNNRRLHIEIALLSICRGIEQPTILTQPSDKSSKPAIKSDTVKAIPIVKKPETTPESTTPKPTEVPAEPKKEEVKTEMKIPPKKMQKVPSLKSIDKMVEEKKNSPEIAEDPASYEKNFSLEDLQKAVSEFTSSFASSAPNLQVALQAEPVNLSDDGVVEFIIPNKILDNELKDIKDDLLPFLQKKLNNKSIRFRTIVKEMEKSELKPFTPKEKYHSILKNHPKVQDFKDQLDLELEY